MAKNKVQYVHGEKPIKKSKWRRRLALILALILFASGIYLLILTLSPKAPALPSKIDLNTQDDANDHRDRIQIERINLEVPFFSGTDASTLEKGVWWRFPDRGSPTTGGNFILSAHRFFLGYTPQGTREKSPFYRLNEVQPGDKIKVYYKDKWYEYEVTKNYAVDRSAVEIENQTGEAKMTLYTCSLAGEADGRVVVDAKPLFDNNSEKSSDEGSPLL
jgi:sortase A